MRVVLALVVVCAVTHQASADVRPPVDLRAHAAKAAKVVVGRVLNVEASLEANEFGDRIIISHVYVQAEETLKGTVPAVVEVLVEGGTVGDLTLRVSDMPVMRANDRAVLFLDDVSPGRYRPHARGTGILKLDAAGRVQDSTLTLDEVRSLVLATTRN